VGRKHYAVLTAALLLTGLAAVPAGAQEEANLAAADPFATVTLITGDKVVVQGEHVAMVRMAPGREQVRYWQYQVNGHDYVVPDDARQLLGQDRLDKRLFDVTDLVRQDYDDGHQPNIPTIVTNSVAARGLTRPVTTVDTPKTEAARKWRERKTAKAAGDQKTWLNGRVYATLDQSVPQVGAPVAWQAGYRGDGVKVAVLDTGYDTGHPDLKAAVAQAQDFTDEGIQDKAGHGTHTASTVAGNGAASQGRYTGVAPGAKLLVGKVLSNQGYGLDSWIINGMNWAVQQGAKVVSMSLGGGTSDGTDLLSQTVNQLSEASGALFVIAAGNSGVRQSVGSPGTADRALTVANVTKQDQLSTTSSQGPRFGDFGLKPEIAAPGTDIVAARAAGTLTQFSVNEWYTKISGTSMATPHVAGAAAILAQQHPDWTGQKIKDTLVGAARRLPGISTFAQGSGRLDVGRAVTQPVQAAGLGGFGEVEGDSTRNVTYTNSGASPVTLTLALDVNHPELFTVDKAVTVPAGSSVTVPLVLHGSATAVGDVTGVLRATSGDVVLNTPVTASVPGARHTLTVKAPPRSGELFGALLIAQNEQTGLSEVAFTDSDTTTFSLPAGRYRLLGRIVDSTAETWFALPADVSGDTSLVVDPQQGKPVTVSIDDPDVRGQGGAGGSAIISDPDETGPASAAAIAREGGVPTGYNPLYTIGGPAMRGLSLVDSSYWTAPLAVTTVDGQGGFEFRDSYAPWALGFTGSQSGRLVDVGEATTDEINSAGDVKDAFAMITPHDWSNPVYPPGKQLTDGLALLKQKGAKAVLSFFNPDIDDPGYVPVLPTVLAFYNTDLRGAQDLVKQRTVTATITARAYSPTAYFLADRVVGAVPAGHAFAFHRAGLGRIDRTLVNTMPPGTYRYIPTVWSFAGTNGGADVEARWPQPRTDYVSPGAALTMLAAAGFVDGTDLGDEIAVPVTLRAGEHRTSRLLGAPFGPELTVPPKSRQDGRPVPWVYREGNQLVAAVPMFADASADNAGSFEPLSTGTTVLSRNGKEVGRRTDAGGVGTFDVSNGRYTLAVDAQRNTTTITPALSPHTRAEWNFAVSSGPGRVALPLLDVRYDLPLDSNNIFTAGKPLVGKVSVAYQPGAPQSFVPGVGVEYSYDDGRTWHQARVTGSRLEIPPGRGDFVSLRATACDFTGNSVVETVIHAYAVK
jgi:subtilisin family serine protease